MQNKKVMPNKLKKNSTGFKKKTVISIVVYMYYYVSQTCIIYVQLVTVYSLKCTCTVKGVW